MDAALYLVFSTILAGLGLLLVRRRRRRLKTKCRCWVRPWLRRRENPGQQIMFNLYKELLFDGEIQEFRATLRMNPDVYFLLLNELKPGLTKHHTNFRNHISAAVRLALTMRYPALGKGFRSVSQQFCVGLSTASAIVRDTCKVIHATLGPRYMKTPCTTAEWLQVAEEFNAKWDFPHCIGAVDGKHCRILAPRNSGSYYFNFKDYHSIVLMAVASADYRFLYLDIGAEGKASDGGIWSKSTFHAHMEDPTNPLNIPDSQMLHGQNVPYVLVGDNAFCLGPHVMKPFPGSGLTRKQRIYKYRLSRCRCVVENTFRILTCRFKLFRCSIEVNPDFVTEIVMATCVLHNFMREHDRAEYIPPVAIDHELSDGNLIPGAWRQEVDLTSMQRATQKNASEYAKKIRGHLADYFVSPAGEIPWQYGSSVL